MLNNWLFQWKYISMLMHKWKKNHLELNLMVIFCNELKCRRLTTCDIRSSEQRGKPLLPPATLSPPPATLSPLPALLPPSSFLRAEARAPVSLLPGTYILKYRSLLLPNISPLSLISLLTPSFPLPSYPVHPS